MLHTHISPRSGTVGQLVADIPSALSLNVPQEKRNLYEDRNIDQTVSRRLRNTAVRFRSVVRSRGNCGGQNGTGVGFLLVLRLPLPILIPPNAPYSCTIRGWYSRPLKAGVPGRLSLFPPTN
jgi:hypothetical protein